MAAPPISVPGVGLRPPIGVDGGVRLDQPIGPPPPSTIDKPSASAIARPATPSTPTPFETLLSSTVSRANGALKQAEQAANDFAAGKSDDIAGTMIAVSQADIQLRLVGSMRNRIIEAFNEIWRMQV